MSQNAGVFDSKPQNNLVVDSKSNNKAVIDSKSQNFATGYSPFETEQLFTVVIPAGQPMGLLMALTYPTAGTVQSPFTS